MKLFIAEKPSLAQAIAAGIGVGKKSDGYISVNGGKEIVAWCYGHIFVQLNPDEYAEKYLSWRMEDLPIVPSVWKLKVKPDVAKQFKIVRELIGKATTIVNAGDPDREGQLLVDEVLDYVGNKKPVQRILLNALDEKSVRQALKDLRDNNEFEGMKNAALGRSRADWLIGMNLSRAYTIRARQVGYEGVSVGRVMTPAMALVVRREEEISKFKAVTHYAVKAIFANNFGEIPATWQMSDNVASLDSEGRLLDKKVAEDFLARLNSLVGRQGKIIRVEEKKKTENQRLPYSLSTLQIEAGKRYGYSPQTVLDTMQMLYEKKLTTYPRSDCEYLPENQYSDVKEILGHLKDLPNKECTELVVKANVTIRSKAWNDKKITAHHATIPTRVKADFEKLNAVEQNLYVMVSQAYLAQFLRCRHVVGRKEGRKSYKVADISEWWGGQENIKLLDPNLLACSEHLELLRQLAETGAYIDITQGLDARLLTEKNISLINELKVKALHLAWDNPRDKSVVAALQHFRQSSKMKNHRKLIVYVLCNYWSSREEDLYRIYWLRDNGFDPYVMVYDKKNAPKAVTKMQR